jgi:CBS domain-containing protein
VVRGLAGFGARSRIHTATILTLSEDLPLRVEWVDQHEVVERLLPHIRNLVDDGLITVEEVQVVQYAPGRERDPLAQPIANAMRTEVSTATPETPVGDIVTLLLRRGRRSLPVVDEQRRVLGIITDGDLLRRAGLKARLDLQEALSAQQLQQQVSALQGQGKTAADIMTQPVVTVQATDTVRKAVDTMVEHGLKRLPVVDKEKRLVGWISRVDVLRTLEYHHLPEEATLRPREGNSVSELMYREVPTVTLAASLEEIIQVLERGRYRRAVVVDDVGHVVGIITDGDLLRRSRLGQHPGLLVRLRSLITGQPARAKLPQTEETAADLMSSPAVTIGEDTPLVEALRLMLEHQCKRLPVVDKNQQLVGLLGRASLLRGLLQENGAA